MKLDSVRHTFKSQIFVFTLNMIRVEVLGWSMFCRQLVWMDGDDKMITMWRHLSLSLFNYKLHSFYAGSTRLVPYRP